MAEGSMVRLTCLTATTLQGREQSYMQLFSLLCYTARMKTSCLRNGTRVRTDPLNQAQSQFSQCPVSVRTACYHGASEHGKHLLSSCSYATFQPRAVALVLSHNPDPHERPATQQPSQFYNNELTASVGIFL